MSEHHPEPTLDEQHQLASTADPQQQSLFFQRLPPEIRSKIYEQVFHSTRLVYSQRSIREVMIKMRPAKNTLSLLRGCRRLHEEIGDRWIGQVLFVFLDYQTMLDKLTTLPPGHLQKMRHFTIRSTVVPLSPNIPNRFKNYGLPSVLKLLDGLRLDTLTVTPSLGYIFSYDILNTLMKHSSGWKELRFLCRSSGMLGFGAYNEKWDGNLREVRRYPEPSHWQSVMEQRDGHLSRPSVVIYRSTICNARDSVLNPSTRTVFEQNVPEGSQARERFGLEDDQYIMADDEKGKEVLVVIRRGHGIDYEEKKDSPLLERDIRREFEDMSWQQIRAEYLYEEADQVGERVVTDDENEDPEVRLRDQAALALSSTAGWFL